MHSHETKLETINVYLQTKSIAKTATKLGLKRDTVKSWISSYKKNGYVKERKLRKPKYTLEQRKAAIDYYLNNGRIIYDTVKTLGYPSRTELLSWVKEDVDDYNPGVFKSSSRQYSDKEKENILIETITSKESLGDIAEKYEINRISLYNWKKEILDTDEDFSSMKQAVTKQNVTNNVDELKDEVTKLQQQADDLQKEVYKLQLEKDILTKAAELIKKDSGINIDLLTNKEKTIIIDALRNAYKLNELLRSLNISKSSYEYNHKVLMSSDKYYDLRIKIKDLFIQNLRRYGYRRIHCLLRKENIIVSEKVVRRIMKEDDLIVYRPRMKKYSSYEGEITPAVENLLKRDFKTDEPFKKLLTDITEFHIPAGKVYLSPMIDCFDGLPLTWTIGTSPNAELANTMLDETIKLTPEGKKPIIHSDRGSHYRWPGWIERMDGAGFIRSMSKKGCSPDNSACEGFFGRLKNEFFYCRDWMNVTIDEFIQELDNYIRWYGETRIKISLGGLSPIDYRKSLNL